MPQSFIPEHFYGKGYNSFSGGNMIDIGQLRECVEQFVADEPERLRAAGWWQTPLTVAATIDNRFERLPRIASDDHFSSL